MLSLDEIVESCIKNNGEIVTIDWQALNPNAKCFEDFREYAQARDILLSQLALHGLLVPENTLQSFFAQNGRNQIHPANSQTGERYNFSQKPHAISYYQHYHPNQGLVLSQVLEEI